MIRKVETKWELLSLERANCLSYSQALTFQLFPKRYRKRTFKVFGLTYSLRETKSSRFVKIIKPYSTFLAKMSMIIGALWGQIIPRIHKVLCKENENIWQMKICFFFSYRYDMHKRMSTDWWYRPILDPLIHTPQWE